MKLSSKKGFSLVELIIVIAILGVIVAIAAPSLTGVLASSRVSADYDSAAVIADSVRIWLTDGTAGQISKREAIIDGAWKSLSEIKAADEDEDAGTGARFAEIINVNQKPAGLADSNYYIKRAKATDQIVVYIDAETPTAISEDAYNYGVTAKSTVTAGVVYVENEIVTQDTEITTELWGETPTPDPAG